MSDFIGSVISLISKSDIRYVGTLVEINPTESTVSLENVKSHGTEGRKADPADEVQGSPQIYEFIVFRGSDVKDLRVDEAPAPKENLPPQMPNDPAIVGARSHPGRAPGGPNHQGPPGAPGFQNPNMFPPYPPQGPPQGWGRGGPPPPGPSGYGMGYPPAGWFPPGQGGFQQNAPPPWAYPGFPGGPPGPGAPPGMQQPHQQHQQQQHQQQQQQHQQHQHQQSTPNNVRGPPQESKAAPGGPGAGQSKAPAPVEMSSDSQVLAQQPSNHANPVAPTPPVASKPSVQEVKETAAYLESQSPLGPATEMRNIPTGPRGAANAAAAAPAGFESAAEAARKAVVQAAIARLGQTGHPSAVPPSAVNGMDNLTRKVTEMSINAVRSGVQNNRGGPPRGRGRGAVGSYAVGPHAARVEIPKSDFDFEQANAKFNRDDMIKEQTIVGDAPEGAEAKDSGDTTPAYDKKTSFFDNIGTDRQRKEAQFDRNAERGKDIDTFGQASVDGGFRRGRGGRGRGFRGRGRGRAGFGAGRGYAPRNGMQTATPQ